MSDTWDNVPALVSTLLNPAQLQRALRERINEAYATLYAQRGTVHTVEDTFEMQRRLAWTEETFKGYVAAFREAAKLLGQLREQELIEARGEQEGVPLDGLTVPDAEGDIRISLDAPAVYDIDVQQLLAVLFGQILEEVHAKEMVGEEAVTHTMERMLEALLSWGKFEPQVSKVKAWGATLARNGRDQDAAVVSGAITKRNPYKGVKFERAKPK